MVTCEKCWREAYSGGSYADVAANYSRLIKKRKNNPCTPEEQAGEDATKCPKCERMTLHQHVGVCMSGCK